MLEIDLGATDRAITPYKANSNLSCTRGGMLLATRRMMVVLSEIILPLEIERKRGGNGGEESDVDHQQGRKKRQGREQSFSPSLPSTRHMVDGRLDDAVA
ncbi:unnamed protein product [Ectocarpus sp. 12 AP-2014]